jgi:hypothetical protein
VDTTKESFQITLNNIASAAEKLGMLAAGVRLEYRHNGAGHPPYVYAVPGDGAGADNLARLATRDASEFLPVFTHKFTRRESMAALEATERALTAAARAAQR